VAAGFLSLIWSTLAASPEDAPWLTRIAVTPWGENPVTYLWHWNLLAIGSLTPNAVFALRLITRGEECVGPALVHVIWLLFATFVHLSGFAASMVDVIYVLE